ncbi:thiaminase II [Helicobacter enhydrae]|uniref:Aminopyrimidine aminohydrolase n=1 Tax=Helicobacter enhydrae TaxID=222136 RepID=A0A1B1U797_9HELI|nr:thiaminase II [Helicobacter enhydrae]ANV98664.1 thiaminase II [Helicobacter enhydrae]
MLFERLLNDNAEIWEDYIHHPFVKQLGNQSLKQENFLFYIKQDYLYLIQYAKCAARLAINARNIQEMQFAFYIAQSIIEGETTVHKSILTSHKLDLRTLGTQDESLTNIAYSRYLLSIGESGDFLDLLIALSSCAIGYAVVGRELFSSLQNLDGHIYKDWILSYASEDFQNFAREYEDLVNAFTPEVTPERFQRLSEIFGIATKLEKAFWQHALELRMD